MRFLSPSTRALGRRALKGAGMIAVVSSITLSVMEGMVRAWGYSRHHICDPIYMAFDRNPEIPYVHRPHLVRARARGLAIIDTDRLGLRTLDGSGPRARTPGEYRIAVMGDSFTFGEGVVRTEDTFTQVLERTLNAGQPRVKVRTFNFGASAYSVREMAATLESRAPEVQPDLAIMEIIPDDFNLDRTPAITSSGYLVDRRFAGVAGPDSKLREALRGLHLSYVARGAWIALTSKRATTPLRRDPGQTTHDYKYVRRFRDLARRQRIPYVVVLLPVSPWGMAPQELSQEGIRHLDLSFIRSEFTDSRFRASRFDGHPSMAVHARIGEALAGYLLEQPDLLLEGAPQPLDLKGPGDQTADARP